MRKVARVLDKKWLVWLSGIFLAGVLISAGLILWQSKSAVAPESLPVSLQKTEVQKTPTEPKIVAETVLEGLSHPWEVAFLPNKTALFNERSGTISAIKEGKKQLLLKVPDVYAVGEGGLTGMTLDQDFAKHSYLFTCHNAKTAAGIDVRVARWKLNPESLQLGERQDIVVGIPSNWSGRHSGCRIKSDTDGNLWVGTGDAAIASTPQDPKSLGGKILHITRDGMPAGHNMPVPFDPRIFSAGHRNTQGIVLFDKPRGDVYGYSIEHGSDVDDEINLLKTGNFGWAPKVTYVEAGIAMTDTARFPDAVTAIWTSGRPTIAPSGATLLTGDKWGTWGESVAMAVLKGKKVKIMKFDATHKLILEKDILGEYGRIRSTNLDPDRNLYITTDNGSNDKIIKVIASQP